MTLRITQKHDINDFKGLTIPKTLSILSKCSILPTYHLNNLLKKGKYLTISKNGTNHALHKLDTNLLPEVVNIERERVPQKPFTQYYFYKSNI